jgi:maltokinase
VVRADLETDAAALLRPDWLAAQRWYGANDRELRSVRVTDAAPLPTAPGTWLLVLAVAFADGEDARYLVPAVHEDGSLREPADGEGAWAGVSAAILGGAAFPSAAGMFRCEGPGRTSPAGTSEHRLGVEQTNTSVLVGDELILKVYRRLQAGVNPEIEVGAFLESVGCDVVPRMAGSMAYIAGGQQCAAAMLQERVASAQTAWEEIGGMLAGADDGPEAALGSGRAIGRVTAALHTGLSARPGDVAFPVRAARSDEVEAWHAAAIGLVERAARAAGPSHAETFASVRGRLDAAYADIRDVRVTRIHGDYHLGQLLKTAGSYAVIDFEGEPARPLAERRSPQPPERDVAGMLRSFDYAARTAERRSTNGFDADAWLVRARDVFLSAYADAAPVAPDPRLLALFELEKACYEVAYEAANRPDWLWLPLDAVSRLVNQWR